MAVMSRTGGPMTLENTITSFWATSSFAIAAIPGKVSSRARSSVSVVPGDGATSRKLVIPGALKSDSAALLRTKMKLVIHEEVPEESPTIVKRRPIRSKVSPSCRS